ncbi:MAG: leucine-rich repeat domain-containing protein [Saccharofermentans sp.]|nr:leucine-rich repeat domain-containing protein [Saccharofermentans sp.]
MEKVTANYMEGEQRICDVWAHYIINSSMTMKEAADYIRTSHVLTNTSAHIIYLDTYTGLSTRSRQGTDAEYDVSYERVDLLKNMNWGDEIGDSIKITRAYTNPMNGEQSLAFCRCTSLEDIDLDPIGLTTIGEYAFYFCKALKKFDIPITVLSLQKDAFFDCTDLKEVKIDKMLHASLDSSVFDKCPVTFTYYSYPSYGNEYTIDGVDYRISYAAYDGTGTVTVFGTQFIQYSTSKLSKIAGYAFSNDYSLKTLYLKKTTKLTKSGVMNSLKYSRVKTVKVKKSKVKKYKKIFKKSNSGRKVTVKK